MQWVDHPHQVVLTRWMFIHPGVEVDSYVDDRSLTLREVIAALRCRNPGKWAALRHVISGLCLW
jgi:hypothetical protein